MKKILVLSAILAGTLFAMPDTYKKCSACHGANGQIAALGKSKIIKDMSKADFIAAMVGYQNGTYGGPMKALMVGQVKGLKDTDIEAMADYLKLK